MSLACSDIRTVFCSAKAHQRIQVDSVNHGVVDSSLKHFKTCAQRLSTVMTSFVEESCLLERIYYKNKNQQRSSLFWRKFEEVRRFVSRVLGLNLVELVDILRYSFYSTENSKTLRTSWTQVPDSSCLFSISKHLIEIGQLLKQMNTRFVSTIEVLIQQFNTLSFAPLVLTVISILSRFNYIISRLRDALRILWTGVIHLIKGLYSQQIERNAKLLKSNPFCINNTDERTSSQVKNKISLPMGVEEDTGSRIITHTVTTTGAPEVSTAPSTLLVDFPSSGLSSNAVSSTPNVENMNFDVEDSNLPQSEVSNSVILSIHTNASAAKRTKKKKRDEIDDIFGQ